MKILGFHLPGTERKSVVTTLTYDQMLAELGGWFKSKSGQSVTYWTALQVATVINCTRAISESLASCPLRPYRRQGRSLGEAKDHPYHDLIAFQPNALQTSFEWREGMMAMAVLAGRGLSEKTYSSVTRPGRVAELLPYLPSQLVPKQVGWNIEYTAYLADGAVRKIDPKDILPLWGPGFGAPIGADIVNFARETIGLQLANEEYQAQQAASGARIPGYFQIKNGFPNKEQREEFQKTFKEKFSGVKKSGETLIVEGDTDWKQIGQNSSEAQILETRNFLIEDICRAFRVFPNMVGHSAKGGTSHASVEQYFIQHVVHTLLPWAKRFEERLNASLLTPEDRAAGYFFKHTLQALLRGDAAGRAALYKALRESTAISPNEIRDFEEMEEITATSFDTPFDDPRMPLNTNPLPAPSKKPGDPNAPGPPPPP